MGESRKTHYYRKVKAQPCHAMSPPTEQRNKSCKSLQRNKGKESREKRAGMKVGEEGVGMLEGVFMLSHTI